MPRKVKPPVPALQPDGEPDETVFHRADVLYCLEWATLAPGIGGWTVLLDNDEMTRSVSVVSPGSSQPNFVVTRVDGQAVVRWLRPGLGRTPDDRHGEREIGRYTTLRAAVLAICPLTEDQVQRVNEAMEMLYPRRIRTR